MSRRRFLTIVTRNILSHAACIHTWCNSVYIPARATQKSALHRVHSLDQLFYPHLWKDFILPSLSRVLFLDQHFANIYIPLLSSTFKIRIKTAYAWRYVASTPLYTWFQWPGRLWLLSSVFFVSFDTSFNCLRNSCWINSHDNYKFIGFLYFGILHFFHFFFQSIITIVKCLYSPLFSLVTSRLSPSAQTPSKHRPSTSLVAKNFLGNE